MPLDPDKKYLTWDAESMAEWLQLKLIEDGNFTDQIFPGSNLNIIVDLLGVYFEMMGYNLNHAASEAMFSDAQFYENLNRIVKLIRYNPNGLFTSNVLVNLTLDEALSSRQTQNWIIPKFTTITSTKSRTRTTDTIEYSFVKDFNMIVEDGRNILLEEDPIIYNGAWKMIGSPFIATGAPFETIVLDNIDPNTVAYPFVTAFIKSSTDGTMTEYEQVFNLYSLGVNDNKMELRINERKQYEIKFGDGITGKRLRANDLIYVVYLKTQGSDGQVLAKDINSAGATLKIKGVTSSVVRSDFLNSVRVNQYLSDADLNKVHFTNYQASSLIVDFEDVDNIRANAPGYWRSQGTLVTTKDVETFVMHNFSKNYEVLDVSVQNNFEYTSEFLGWLYSYDKLTNDIRYSSYKFADTCDFNNIYIWVKSNNDYNYNVSDSNKLAIRNECDKYKTATSELIVLDPLLVNFAPFVLHGLPSDRSEYRNIINNEIIEDPKHFIVVHRDRNSFVTKERIYNKVIEDIREFFKVNNNSLGQVLSIQNLYHQLMNIDGVQKVTTLYDPNTGVQNRIVFDGLSMGVWTNSLVNREDFTVVNGTIKLKSFQFPTFFDVTKISNLVKVVSENYNLSTSVL